MAGCAWHDLEDPDREALERAAGVPLHDRALDLLLAPAHHDDEPRPTFEAHIDYVFGLLLLPHVDHETHELWYQEIDLVADARHGGHRAQVAPREDRCSTRR